MSTTRKTLTIIIATLTMITATTPQADAGNPPTPIDHLIDCTDSFWAVTCSNNKPEPIPKVCERHETRLYDCHAFYTHPIGEPTPRQLAYLLEDFILGPDGIYPPGINPDDADCRTFNAITYCHLAE